MLKIHVGILVTIVTVVTIVINQREVLVVRDHIFVALAPLGSLVEPPLWHIVASFKFLVAGRDIDRTSNLACRGLEGSIAGLQARGQCSKAAGAASHHRRRQAMTVSAVRWVQLIFLTQASMIR